MQVQTAVAPLSAGQKAAITRRINIAAATDAIALVASHFTGSSFTIDVSFPNGEAFELYANSKGSQFKLTGTNRVALSALAYPALVAKSGETQRQRFDRIAAVARKSATLAKFVNRLTRA